MSDPVTQGHPDYDFVQAPALTTGILSGRQAMVYQRHKGGSWAQIASGQSLLDGYDEDGRARGWYFPGAFTQFVGNSALIGAAVGVVGADGALPTGWVATGFGGGLSLEVVAVGTDQQTGLPSVRLRWSGTNSGPGTAYPAVSFAARRLAPAATGEVWTASVKVRPLTDGVLLELQIREAKSDGSHLASSFKKINISQTMQDVSVTRKLTAIETAYVGAGLRARVPAGRQMANELVIAAPQLVELAFAPDILALGLDGTGSIAVDAEQATSALTLLKPFTVLCQFSAAPGAQDKDTAILALRDASQNRLTFLHAADPAGPNFKVATLTAGQATPQVLLAGAVTGGARNCIAFRYDNTTLTASLNGGPVVASTAMANLDGFLSLDLNANAAGAGFHAIQRLAIWRSAASDTELRQWSGNPPVGGVINISDVPARVSPDAAVGSTVGVTARASNAVLYSLDDDGEGRFAIDPSTGVVTIANALDQDATTQTIVVRATSAGGLFATGSFTITVSDQDEVWADQVSFVPSGSITAVSVQAAINEIDAEKAPISRQVATQHSLTGGGSLTADRTLGLVNDVAAPGAAKYYGTDTSGSRGWQTMPSGGGAGAIAVERDNSEVLAAASRLNFTGSGVTIANAGGGEVTVTVPGPSAHTHADLFAADADVGLVMSAESTVSATWTPSVADAAIIRAATSANLQVNTPGAVAGAGEIKKTLQVRNASAGTIILTFSGFGGYDGVEPPRSLVGGEVARFISRTENRGTTWTISGDSNYVSWPPKATPGAGDLLLIADGADGNKLKRIAVGALSSGGTPTVLAANQYEAKRNDNAGREARTDKRSACFVAPISADGTFTVALWPDVPMRLSQVSARTSAGTCAIQVRKNGNAISGFASPLSLSTSVSAATSTETLAENDYLTLVVTASSALRGVAVTFKGTRTAN